MEDTVSIEDRIAIRVTRRTHTRSGETAEAHSVPCPRQCRSVSLEECLSCEYCEGASFDPKDSEYFLTCVPEMEQDASPVRVPDRTDAIAASTIGTTRVSEIMTTPVHCVTEDMRVDALIELLLEQNISGVPVVDAEGRPVGIVSKTDFVREVRDNAEAEADDPSKLRQGSEVDIESGFRGGRVARSNVGEIMMPIAFCIEETTPIARAAALMAVEGVHRIPVVSGEGAVIGIVSSLDILRFVAKEATKIPLPMVRP